MPKRVMVIGIRHRNAGVELREQFALTDGEQQALLQYLRPPLDGSVPQGLTEAAVVSTCNRTEIYVSFRGSAQQAYQSVRAAMLAVKQVDLANYRLLILMLLDEDAVRHLYRVACGLDSQILGEGQILGQVKTALTLAQQAGSVNSTLDKVFKSALVVGKRVRTETDIARRDLSVARAAHDYVHAHMKNLPDFQSARIVLLGGGQMAEIIMEAFAKYLPEPVKANVTVVNRSQERLDKIHKAYGFTGVRFAHMAQVLPHASVVLVATGAPHFVVEPEDFAISAEPEALMANRLIIDISVPRNVDPRVGDLPGVSLVNVDDLAAFAGLTLSAQGDLMTQAHHIIEDELEQFARWQIGLQATPTITQLRQKLETMRQAQLPGAPGEDATAQQLTTALVNKILHGPTVKLKSVQNQHDIQRHIEVLANLFDLDTPQRAPMAWFKAKLASKSADLPPSAVAKSTVPTPLMSKRRHRP
jgi:glutamyl-tRNA reductase